MDRREKETVIIPHQLIMQDRARLELTGITGVDSFDDRTVICHTSLGDLTVNGRDLRMFRLDIDGTALSVEGHIESLIYSDVKKGGLFGRLLR